MCDFTYIEVANIKRYKKCKKHQYNNEYKQNNSCVISHSDKAQKYF